MTTTETVEAASSAHSRMFAPALGLGGRSGDRLRQRAAWLPTY